LRDPKIDHKPGHDVVSVCLMHRVRVDFEPAYLLSQRPYRETSQLVEAFTLNHGRVGLVARGVRGPKARQRGVLRPFAPLLLSWISVGDLGTLTGAERSGMPLPLSGERIFFGWYLNELLLRLLQRHIPHEALYAVYENTLAQLPTHNENAEAALRIFEKRLLSELGYAPPLVSEFDATRRYRFDSESDAFVPAHDDDPRAFAAHDLTALRDENLNSREALRAARRLLRSALARQLNGRELETPKLLRAMRRGGFGEVGSNGIPPATRFDAQINELASPYAGSEISDESAS
jgi:DNA repair protein RecO (recombination protein O)